MFFNLAFCLLVWQDRFGRAKKVNLKYDEIKQLYDLEQVTKKVNFDAPNLVLELVREKIL